MFGSSNQADRILPGTYPCPLPDLNRAETEIAREALSLLRVDHALLPSEGIAFRTPQERLDALRLIIQFRPSFGNKFGASLPKDNVPLYQWLIAVRSCQFDPQFLAGTSEEDTQSS